MRKEMRGILCSAALQPDGLINQHDGDAIANRVSQSAGFADDLPVLFIGDNDTLALRAGEDFQKLLRQGHLPGSIM
jgi:hypothetical protein